MSATGMDPSMDLSITTKGLSITSMEEELVHLRKQNLEMKDVVRKGLTEKLAWTTCHPTYRRIVSGCLQP